uniref:Uncharacterized protein n=1 Tax=Nothobranchius pienaari TaxID=704102 RepID=A0A1A8LML7_9TELE
MRLQESKSGKTEWKHRSCSFTGGVPRGWFLITCLLVFIIIINIIHSQDERDELHRPCGGVPVSALPGGLHYSISCWVTRKLGGAVRLHRQDYPAHHLQRLHQQPGSGGHHHPLHAALPDPLPPQQEQLGVRGLRLPRHRDSVLRQHLHEHLLHDLHLLGPLRGHRAPTYVSEGEEPLVLCGCERGILVCWWSGRPRLHPHGSTENRRRLFRPELLRELCQDRVGRATPAVQHSESGLLLAAALRGHTGVLPAGSQTHLQHQNQNGTKGGACHLRHHGHHAALLPTQPRGIFPTPPAAHGRDPELLRTCRHLQRPAGHHGTGHTQHVSGPRAVLPDHQLLQMGVVKEVVAVGAHEQEQRGLQHRRPRPTVHCNHKHSGYVITARQRGNTQ